MSRPPPVRNRMTSQETEARRETVAIQTLPLAREELEVSKHLVPRATIEVRTVTEERPELVDVPVARERVEITRVPVGREVEAAPAIREEGDLTIIPVVEEIIVVERRLRVKEEIHLRRVRSTERHRETVTVRAQTAVVTRIPLDDAPDEVAPETTIVGGESHHDAGEKT